MEWWWRRETGGGSGCRGGGDGLRNGGDVDRWLDAVRDSVFALRDGEGATWSVQFPRRNGTGRVRSKALFGKLVPAIEKLLLLEVVSNSSQLLRICSFQK